MTTKRLTTDEFVERANTVHNDKFIYSSTVYKNIRSRVSIECPAHGEFLVNARSHLNGTGCPKCCNNVPKYKNTQAWVQRAKDIFPCYDYSCVKYTNCNTHVDIICNIHGKFSITPTRLLAGHGCSKCRVRKAHNKLSQAQFIEKSKAVHDDTYCYANSVYKNNSTKVTIHCRIHGEFTQRPADHFAGNGCPKCRLERLRLSYSDFVQKATHVHGKQYSYIRKENNVYARTSRIDIVCKTHGKFRQLINNHLQGAGCPKCNNNSSKSENKWLDSFNCKIIKQHYLYIDNRRYVVDGYDPATNTVYEFYGDYWHGNPEIYHLDEINKTLNCTFGKLFCSTVDREIALLNAGYRVNTMWESSWKRS